MEAQKKDKIIVFDAAKYSVEIKNFSITNDLIYEYFKGIPEATHEEKLRAAIYIGVLALSGNHLSGLLGDATNEINARLGNLKIIYDMKRHLLFKSSFKGVDAENKILDRLKTFFKEHDIKDDADPTGDTTGEMPDDNKNKTGDIVCKIESSDETKIVIESKVDKQVTLGEIIERNVATKPDNYVWGQLLEGAKNRNAKFAIMVLDEQFVDPNLKAFVENVKLLPGIGLVAIVDAERGDYTNLFIAYRIARMLVLETRYKRYDCDLLRIIIQRLIRACEDTFSIKKMVKANIIHNQKILEELNKSLLLFEDSSEMLTNYVENPEQFKDSLWEFYNGGKIRSTYKTITKELLVLPKANRKKPGKTMSKKSTTKAKRK